MRYHAEYCGEDVGINCYGDEFAEYLSSGELTVNVDWGANHSELYKMIMEKVSSGPSIAREKLRALITVHGIGRRPAMALVRGVPLPWLNL